MDQFDVSFYEALSCAFGPSGMEKGVRDLIIPRIRDHVDTLRIDGIGNLIATRGDREKGLICAHMDEVGFMITSILEDGTCCFSSVGGIDPKNLASKRVILSDGKTRGVISSKPVHLSKDKMEEKGFQNLVIDFGFDSFEKASKKMLVGDFAVFDTDFHCAEGVVFGKAHDNRIGCYLLCKLLEEELLADGTFVFTVQEETGLRGASAVLETNKIPFGIALDTTTANDLPGVNEHLKVCSLGKGPVISFADGATIYDRDRIRAIFRLLAENGISAQTKTKRTGGNEASSIEKIGFGAVSVSISVPCRYIHSPVGLFLESDLELTLQALIAVYQEFVKGV